MFDFNDLKFISPKMLKIDVSVVDLEYFDNVTIGRILIDTEDTVLPTGPSEKAMVFNVPENTLKSFSGVIDVSELVKNGSKMLFVYIECGGVPSPSTPCGLDSEYSMKPVVNYECIYKEGLNKAKCLGSCKCLDGDCEIDVDFANFALQYFRLVTALENDAVEAAYDAWYHLSHRGGKKRLGVPTSFKVCGCNG